MDAIDSVMLTYPGTKFTDVLLFILYVVICIRTLSKFSNQNIQIPVLCVDMCHVEELCVLFIYLFIHF